MKDLYASGRETASLAPQLSIADWAIVPLQAEPANPRRHSKRRPCTTINAFAFGARIRCHRDGDIIAGRRRLAAGALRITGATLRFDHLALAQARHAKIGPALNDLGTGVEAVYAI